MKLMYFVFVLNSGVQSFSFLKEHCTIRVNLCKDFEVIATINSEVLCSAYKWSTLAHWVPICFYH